MGWRIVVSFLLVVVSSEEVDGNGVFSIVVVLGLLIVDSVD